MLKQEMIEGRFRLLDKTEISAVSGGSDGITVYGNSTEYLNPTIINALQNLMVTSSIPSISLDVGDIDLSNLDIDEIEDNSQDFTDEDGDGLDDTTGEPLTIVVTPNTIGICGGGGASGVVGQGCVDAFGNTSVRGGIGTPGLQIDMEDTRSISEFGVDVNTTNITVNVPTEDIADSTNESIQDIVNSFNSLFETFSDGLYDQFNLDQNNPNVHIP